MIVRVPIYFEITWEGEKGPDAKETKKLLQEKIEKDFSSSPLTIAGSWFSDNRVRARPIKEDEVKEKLRTSK